MTYEHTPARGCAIGVGGCLGLIVLSCLGLVLIFFVVPQTPYYANYVPIVTGKLELLAPAQWHPGGGILSPQGRYMLLGWQRDSTWESSVWDMTNGERYPYRFNSAGLCWVNEEQFVVATLSNTYFIVQAHGAVSIPVQQVGERWYNPTPEEQMVIRARWQQASRLYILSELGVSGKTVVTIEHEQPYIYLNGKTGEENLKLVPELAKGLPQQTFATEGWTRPSPNDPFPSHDGRLLAQIQNSDGYRLRITTPDGQVLAEAGKPGWYPDPIGWAADSSGVYVRMVQLGGMLSMSSAYTPIFKLSPMTPEEQRIHQLQQVGIWSGVALGAVALTGSGVWWWRRRRARQAA